MNRKYNNENAAFIQDLCHNFFVPNKGKIFAEFQIKQDIF